MSHLLRRPAAVPALFAQGETDAAPRRRRSAARAPAACTLALLPALALTVELPLIHGATEILRLALPY